MRVAFAKVCALNPQMLVLDEPTNHLDIYSIDALTDAVQGFQGAVVVVTHNRSMLRALCDEVIVVQDGSCTSVRLGDDSPGSWLLQHVFHETAGGRFGLEVRPAERKLVGSHLPNVNQAHEGRERRRRLGACPVVGLEAKLAQPTVAPTLEGAPQPAAASILEGASQPLKVTEREFLRCVKRVREMLKLEALKSSGSLLKTQAEKLQRKEDALKELAESESYLPCDSSLREKNADLLELLRSS